ncbi:R3H-associated N-terminal domain-containing protein [Sordaria brevicollis]|uniref:R3H-associated N-terminal domain-containing protein n=1 Tax=Sordaria brevicollis TaxID=83679 RepID=A0AAE0PHD4_SORBR|nr:R3H-associated N-terminal domain-containing protein [Sordaria brevicollis]
MAITKLAGPVGHHDSDDDYDYDEPSQHPQPVHQEPDIIAPQPVPVPVNQSTISNVSTAAVDIEAWTVAALESLRIANNARGAGHPLAIPLDGPVHGEPAAAAGGPTDPAMKLRNVVFDDGDDVYAANVTPPRRPPSRRDSMKRREALLKGKEGSRQRRRWENDRLVGVPNVQPPQPSDWAIGPTYPLHDNIPYHLAQYWDKGLRERVEERKAAWAVHRKKTVTATSHQPGGATTAISLVVSSSVAKTRADVGKVPKDLRATAKKTPAVKAWLRVLEEPVREFVVQQQRGAAKRDQQQQPQHKSRESGNQSDEIGSDEEEILFTGRKTAAAAATAAGSKQSVKNTSSEKGAQNLNGIQLLPDSRMVLDTLGDNENGASFKRWLTHSISDYYGLDSKSVMVANPARKVVYIGLKQVGSGPKRRAAPTRQMLIPPPLWEMF